MRSSGGRGISLFRNKRLIWAVAIAAGIGIWLITLIPKGMQENAHPVEDIDHNESESGKEGPMIVNVRANEHTVGMFEKLELTIDVEASYDNPYDPDEIDLFAELVSPSGIAWRINGFYDGLNWLLRFSPDESGAWSYQLKVKDRTGEYHGEKTEFHVTPNEYRGWIQVSKRNPRFLEYRNGDAFYGIGVAYPWNITPFQLDRLAQHGVNLITYWNGNYDHAGNGGGTEQLESVRSGIGRYDMRKAERIDELLEAFEARQLHMSFVIWPHDSLADHIPGWPATWKSSAYSTLGEAVEFYENEDMWAYQEKLYRYMIARWGHSRALGIWDIICEINGTDGWAFGRSEAANKWAEKAHAYFKANDPYGHPTMGSMAGNRDDYWEHGYQIFDLADRENYYDLHYSAYAADIQERYSRYGKPVMMGETGNIADVRIYQHAAWTALVNGLASTPIWWDITHVNDEMLMQMQRLSEFVSDIDFLEERIPVVVGTRMFEKQLPDRAELAESASMTEWSIPDWPDANKDEHGKLAEVQWIDDSGPVLSASFRFATGGYSQGVIQHIPKVTDWREYDRLTLEVYVEEHVAIDLRAIPVLFPNGEWNEVLDVFGTALSPGEWTRVEVTLDAFKENYWRNRAMSEEDYGHIAQWGLKVDTTESQTEGKPIELRIRNIGLKADQAPIVQVKEADAWAMVGQQLSYGWVVTEQLEQLSGIELDVPQFNPGRYEVLWYDPWEGVFTHQELIDYSNGAFKLIVPETEQTDLAFKIIKR